MKLTQGEQVRIGSGRATNFEAWELEQRSLHLFQRFTRENNTRARQLAESSVDLDPNYALAWVRLAWTHALDVRYAWVEDRVGALSSATEAAQKALALDETLPDAHAALGFIHTLKREHEEAVADMRNAVALDPNHATAMALLAVSLTRDWDRAVPRILRPGSWNSVRSTCFSVSPGRTTLGQGS